VSEFSARQVDQLCRKVREAEAARFDGDGQYLVPWGELPKRTKDWYRQRVGDVLKALADLERTARRSA